MLPESTSGRMPCSCSGWLWLLAVLFSFEIGIGTLHAQEEILGDREAYHVQAGDVLFVSVWREEDLQKQVLVRPDVRFSFPLAGDVDASGKTIEDLRQELSRKLERYIPDLVVTVSIEEINGNKVYVLGQVNNPGEFVVNPSVDVMQALSMAGGTTAFAALNDIRILRREGGRSRSIEFRYADVERGRNLEQNIILQSGDVVVVP